MGHERSTQTRGVWLWGEPLSVEQADRKLSVVLFDTEGFESTGKADAYDDRIFALSALLSAVLIYNLPETVRESDIEKLSFAVQLADGFYADAEVCARCLPATSATCAVSSTCMLCKFYCFHATRKHYKAAGLCAGYVVHVMAT